MTTATERPADPNAAGAPLRKTARPAAPTAPVDGPDGLPPEVSAEPYAD